MLKTSTRYAGKAWGKKNPINSLQPKSPSRDQKCVCQYAQYCSPGGHNTCCVGGGETAGLFSEKETEGKLVITKQKSILLIRYKC